MADTNGSYEMDYCEVGTALRAVRGPLGERPLPRCRAKVQMS